MELVDRGLRNGAYQFETSMDGWTGVRYMWDSYFFLGATAVLEIGLSPIPSKSNLSVLNGITNDNLFYIMTTRL
jgi:hypothetical protein